MNQIILQYLREHLDHLLYYNKMAPFNIYDSEYVEEVKNTIMKLENENKIDYNDEPVVACKYCKSLHIVIDEVDNNICMRCGSVNELKEFKNIHEYKKFVDNERN